MKKTHPQLKPKKVSAGDAFVTAQQASATLNLPLYYFINPAKRDELGVPHYFINRMVRYRLKELHRWQLSRTRHLQHAEQIAAAGAKAATTSATATTAVEGGADA